MKPQSKSSTASPTAIPYNTALGSKAGLEFASRDALAEIEHAASVKGVVFAHAIGAPYHPGELAVIAEVACIYSELPWPIGWATFHQRAGITPQRSHADYIVAVKTGIVDFFKKPTFLICDKRSAHKFSPRIRSIRLNGDSVWLAAVHVAEMPEGDTTQALLAGLARRYASVYDFGCGYGGALRPFARFVGSDIDRKCLAYVARELL